MKKLAIVTDSTPCLSPELIAQNDIHIIPLKLQWENQTYLDGIDITPTEFYRRLEKAKSLPTTSQPSPQEFLGLFEQLAPQYDGILVLLISSGISGTVGSAQSAAAEFDQLPIQIIDTRITAGAQAMVVLKAARAAAEGASLEAAADIARRAIENMHVFFTVDTLEYLHKGGRIGGASRYLGTMLDIKPVLFLNPEGKIDALERVRTRRKALERLVELVVMNSANKPAHLSVFHAAALQAAQEVLERTTIQMNCQDSLLLDLSPVIGSHVGPGTIGVAVYTE